jgi:hypothetical protein
MSLGDRAGPLDVCISECVEQLLVLDDAAHVKMAQETLARAALINGSR